MKKLDRISLKLKNLNAQRIEVDRQARELRKQINIAKRNYADAYTDFFTQKSPGEFVLYKSFPSRDAIEAYSIQGIYAHPLQDYGDFNIKELVEIIKHLYQEKRQEEYQILTMGTSLREEGELEPHLFFAIGNQETLDFYQQFNSYYFNDEVALRYMLRPTFKNLISLEAKPCYKGDSVLEVLTGKKQDIPGVVNFKDYKRGDYKTARFSLQKNIFRFLSDEKINSLKKAGGITTKDTLDIEMNSCDFFIAKVLISIAIYKKRNNIKELTEQDYNHIFEVLFGHPINIIEEAEKDIPKSLIYVPRAYED